jgi:NAD(P)-dependent dehydrogenase (short-subunit alcohol dehydrogenase family)
MLMGVMPRVSAAPILAAAAFDSVALTNLTSIFLDRNPGALDRRLVHWPMGRFGSLEEAAGTIAFLASDDSGVHHCCCTAA